MDPLAELLTAVARLGVVDSYQYVSGSRQPIGLPSDIRIIVRERPAGQLGSTVHDQFTLVVALAGSGLAAVEGERLRVEPGTALLVQPGQVHGYEDLVEEPVRWLFVGFHHPDQARWADLRDQVVAMPPRVVQDLAAMLADHFHDVAHGKRHTASGERQVALRLELVLERLAAESRARTAQPTDPDGVADLSHRFVQKVVAHVAAHLADHLSIEGIARALRLSPGHLRNEFQRLAGIGVGRYIRVARIRQACVLLDTTELAVAEVGRRCGYDSVYSFSRAFRADKGLPPSAYRRKLRPVP